MKPRLNWAVLAFSLSVLAGSKSLAQGQATHTEGVDKVAIVEKIALVFTGRFPSPQDLERVSSGALEPGEYFDSLKNNPAVEAKLTEYWLSVLKINGKFEPTTVMNPGSPPTVPREDLVKQASRFAFDNSMVVDISKISFSPAYNTLRNRVECPEPRITRVFNREVIFNDAFIADQKAQCQAMPDEPAAPKAACINRWNTYETTGRPAQLARLDSTECACGTEISVRPWWNPGVSMKACQEAVTKCGTDLGACEVLDTRLDPRLALRGYRTNYNGSTFYGTDVIEALTTEPGRIVAKNIIEGADFRSVLTSQATYLNGAAEHFLSGPGSLLVRNGPPNSYKLASGQSSLISNQPSRRTYRRVERGNGHAGILTTPMFQQVTNGYRAKANRIYEGFLCKRFVIGANLPPSPSNVTDLELREPCAQCHRILEPMGRYLSRWELEGVNYLYSASRNANGAFGGHSGTDAAGLGTAVGLQGDFESCAVQRAFEIAMGRELSAPEAQHLLPELTSIFRQNGRKLWPVLKAIVASPNFKGAFQ